MINLLFSSHFNRMEDIQTYQQVLNNADYAADPVGTITAQLRQRIESGSL